jgi:hypothetical protein
MRLKMVYMFHQPFWLLRLQRLLSAVLKNYLSYHKNKKIWVHCAANMHVSAFVYKYRRDELGLEDKDINKDLKAIWKPNNTWQSFLNLE